MTVRAKDIHTEQYKGGDVLLETPGIDGPPWRIEDPDETGILWQRP